MTKVAIIGGTGFDQIQSFQVHESIAATTPYGSPSGDLTCGQLYDKPFVFLPRHGVNHTIPPHRVNYRANLWALKEQGVTQIVAIAAVGTINPDICTGCVVIPDQIIDYTWGREHTFSDGAASQLQHIDFTKPYSASLRSRLVTATSRANLNIPDRCTYAATQGPRLETAAEIDRLEKDGADIVGMTGMPEAALARELSIEYACLAIVVNPAAGRGGGAISMDEIRKVLKDGSNLVMQILEQF